MQQWLTLYTMYISTLFDKKKYQAFILVKITGTVILVPISSEEVYTAAESVECWNRQSLMVEMTWQ